MELFLHQLLCVKKDFIRLFQLNIIYFRSGNADQVSLWNSWSPFWRNCLLYWTLRRWKWKGGEKHQLNLPNKHSVLILFPFFRNNDETSSISCSIIADRGVKVIFKKRATSQSRLIGGWIETLWLCTLRKDQILTRRRAQEDILFLEFQRTDKLPRWSIMTQFMTRK